jgi:hypothetical protein
MRRKLWRTGALTRLRVLCVAAIAVLAGAFASTASADLVYPAGQACPFALQIETVVDNEKAAVVFPADANGDVRVIITGRLVERLTNLENGNSLVENVSGPVFLTIHPDGSFDAVLGGRSEITLYPSDIPAGPMVLLNSGRLIIETVLAAAGQHIGGLQTILHTQIGNAENICTLLA